MFRTNDSPKHVEPFNEKNKDNSQEFVHLVGLYTHCNISCFFYAQYFPLLLSIILTGPSKEIEPFPCCLNT